MIEEHRRSAAAKSLGCAVAWRSTLATAPTAFVDGPAYRAYVAYVKNGMPMQL